MPQNRLRGPPHCPITPADSASFATVSSWGWTPAAGRCYLLSSSPRRRRQHVRRVVWRLVFPGSVGSGGASVWGVAASDAGPVEEAVDSSRTGRSSASAASVIEAPRDGWRQGHVTRRVARSGQQRQSELEQSSRCGPSGARARELRSVESDSSSVWSGPGRSGPRGAGCPRVGGSFYFTFDEGCLERARPRGAGRPPPHRAGPGAEHGERGQTSCRRITAHHPEAAPPVGIRVPLNGLRKVCGEPRALILEAETPVESDGCSAAGTTKTAAPVENLGIWVPGFRSVKCLISNTREANREEQR